MGPPCAVHAGKKVAEDAISVEAAMRAHSPFQLPLRHRSTRRRASVALASRRSSESSGSLAERRRLRRVQSRTPRACVRLARGSAPRTRLRPRLRRDPGRAPRVRIRSVSGTNPVTQNAAGDAAPRRLDAPARRAPLDHVAGYVRERTTSLPGADFAVKRSTASTPSRATYCVTPSQRNSVRDTRSQPAAASRSATSWSRSRSERTSRGRLGRRRAQGRRASSGRPQPGRPRTPAWRRARAGGTRACRTPRRGRRRTSIHQVCGPPRDVVKVPRAKYEAAAQARVQSLDRARATGEWGRSRAARAGAGKRRPTTASSNSLSPAGV